MDPFITVEQLSAYMRQTLSEDDELVALALDAACQVCRDVAEQDFELVDNDVIKMNGTGTNVLLLPQLPVTDVAQILDHNGDVVDTEDYAWTEDGELMKTSCTSTWWEGIQNFEVTYSHGYEAVPTSIQLVACALADRIIDQGIVSQETIGGYVVLYGQSEGGLTKLERAILERHRPGR